VEYVTSHNPSGEAIRRGGKGEKRGGKVEDDALEMMIGSKCGRDQGGGRSPEWKVLGFRWRWRTLSRHLPYGAELVGNGVSMLSNKA
jgi:hypothetical protein